MNLLSQSGTLTLLWVQSLFLKEEILESLFLPRGKQVSSPDSTVPETQHVMHTPWKECPPVSHFLG